MACQVFTPEDGSRDVLEQRFQAGRLQRALKKGAPEVRGGLRCDESCGPLVPPDAS